MPRQGSRTSERHHHQLPHKLKPQQSGQIRIGSTLFITLLVFRILNALLVQTAFVPDEYWQSMEVAHKWTFGYGSLTWEWHPQTALRSPLHPLLVSLIYRLGALMHLDSRLFVIYAPRLFHAFLGALTDFHLYKMAYSVCGPQIAKWTLFHQLSNWFTFYCAPRTLVNCLEWCLTTVGLSYFPWHPNPKSTNPKFIMIGLVCVLMRPTAAVIWAPLYLLHLYQLCKSLKPDPSRMLRWSERLRHYSLTLIQIIPVYFMIAIPCFVCSILLDRLTYGYWTCNQWNFIRFNLLSKGSEAYGTHPWHWYLSQGLPAILTSQLLFVACAIWWEFTNSASIHDKSLWMPTKLKNLSLTRLTIYLSMWTVFCYSLLAHKEFRFMFPLMPLIMCICGQSSYYFIHFVKSNRRFFESAKNRQLMVILFTLLSQAPLALYASILHQRGGMDTILRIGGALDRMPEPDRMRLLALMPCHSIPSVSFLHHNVSFRQLQCDPNLPHLFPNSDYVDEADLFYEDPLNWLRTTYSTTSSIGSLNKPNYIIAFDHLTRQYPSVRELLTNQWGYRLCEQFFFSHVLTHRRHGHEIHVYCDSNSSL